MSKQKMKLEKIKENVLEEDIAALVDPSSKYLSENSIYFWTSVKKNESPLVPPSTPSNISNVVQKGNQIPATFPSLQTVELPYVKEVGVKKCIEILGNILGCNDYAFDHLQFWFLDMLTDCLWKVQDEYNFAEKEQKIVMEWMMYVFRIMSDPKLCYSRKKFFAVFKEAIMVAGDVINEGEAEVPLPENLFKLVDDQNEDDEMELNSDDDTSVESVSTISMSTFKSDNIVEVQFGDKVKEFTISKDRCHCSSDLPTPSDSVVDSTAYSASDASDHYSREIVGDESGSEEEDSETFENRDYKQFYIPDPYIPKRFLSLDKDSSASTIESDATTLFKCDGLTAENEEEEYTGKTTYVTDFDYLEKVPPSETQDALQYGNVQVALKDNLSNAKKISVLSQGSTLINPKVLSQNHRSTSFKLNGGKSQTMKISDNDTTEEKLSDAQALKKLAKYKLWEQRMRDMDDPRKGWVPVKISLDEIKPDEVNSDVCLESDFDDILEENDKEDDKGVISMFVLYAIIDLVFEYFYQSFHFTLIKLAVRATPHIITQALNSEWNVPKENKEELQRPKPTPMKKEKKPTQGKIEKKLSKKDDKTPKVSKKGKDENKKGSKVEIDKKSKKETTNVLTKEEIAELERQKELQEAMEEENRRREENKFFMFPLKDAATDDLFKDIFDGWVTPKADKKDKKDKTEKGQKKK